MPDTMPAANDALTRIVTSIQTSGALNVILWLLSLGAGAVVGAWVLWGGPIGEAEIRSRTVENLWPLALAWTGSLVGKSKVTSDQKRELVRADSALRVARLNAGTVIPTTMGPVVVAREPGPAGEGTGLGG